jgi:hypothetical protein
LNRRLGQLQIQSGCCEEELGIDRVSEKWFLMFPGMSDTFKFFSTQNVNICKVITLTINYIYIWTIYIPHGTHSKCEVWGTNCVDYEHYHVVW